MLKVRHLKTADDKQKRRFAAVFKLSCNIMKEQVQAAEAVEETLPTEPQEEATEESQPEVTESDVVSEEEADVEETEPEKVQEPAEPEGEQPQDEPEQEEDIPFTERPGVKERLKDIEEKYGSKATYWDTIAEISQEDPEFRLAVLEKLEASGKLPAGTVEAEKKKLSSLQDSEKYVDQMPEDVKADLKAAREFRQQREAQQREEMQKAEEFFTSFEAKRPDIAKTSNPQRTRNLIYNLAVDIAEKGEEDFEAAMDQAYKVVVHGTKEENDAVRRKVQQVQEDSSTPPAGGVSKTGRTRKLTQAEKRGAELAGMTPEEYIKYKDTPEEELFENI